MASNGRAALAALLVSCLPMPERGPQPEPPPPIEPLMVRLAEGTPLASIPNLHAVVHAPARVTYDAQTIGAGGQRVMIRITNVGARPAPVARLHATFSVSLDGVAFSCSDHESATTTHHEPASLAPGESFGFERTLDCMMPLVGRYDVRVYVGFLRGDATSLRDFVGATTVEIVAGGARVPREVPEHEGLYVLLTGARATLPMPPEAWARGDYHAVVALINGAPRVVPVGPASLSFVVYRRGSSIPCAGEAVRIATPDSLAPGEMHAVKVAISCAPSSEGKYEIVGRLTLAGAHEIEIGGFDLEVTSDPRTIAPVLF